MIRVLMVTTRFYPVVGGAEKQAQRLAKKLIGRGLDVRVVTGWWDRSTPRKENVDGIPVLRNFTFWGMLGVKGIRKFGTYAYMATLFLYLLKCRKQYDIIHIHTATFPAFVGVLGGKLLGKPSVVKVMTSGEWGDIRRMQENRIMPGTRQMLPIVRQADCAISLNDQVTQELIETGFRRDRIICIPNGVEIDHKRVKTTYELDREITLAFIGRLHPQKGLDVLLKALSQLVETRPENSWRLLILGDGILRQELEEMARRLGVSATTQFCGRVDNVFDYLAQTDVFVLPSRAEGISNALLEAMACGLPCIATAIEGNKEVIVDGQNGLLVECDSEYDLAEAIERLVKDHELRARLGRGALRTVEETYSIDHVAGRYVRLYEHLLHTPVTSLVSAGGGK